MAEAEQKIKELEDRLDRLVRTQIGFQQEVTQIRNELTRLRSASSEPAEPRSDKSFYEPEVRSAVPPPVPPSAVPPPPQRPRPPVSRDVIAPSFGMASSGRASASDDAKSGGFSDFAASYSANARTDLEKFIGENLISKIGIVVLIIGVGIGVKYSIDNELISPLARIIAGYVFGFGLTGLAIKLKPKYHNFSAALLSGGMAIMYFVTYFAYSLYALVPQSSAFALMVIFTVFTVTSAWVYNRQIIAHIGLVGAYGVPFLLSSDSGNYVLLFSYMTIVNLGILAVSLKRHWRPLFFTAFGFTWLIFIAWFSARYVSANDLYPTLLFLGIFFVIFSAVAIILNENGEDGDRYWDLGSAFATGFVFYCLCLAIANGRFTATEAWVFFSYLAAVAVAICFVSFRYLGRFPIYLAFMFSWLIYGVWFVDRYSAAEHSLIAPVAALSFFAIFYTAVLGHRLLSKEMTLIENTGLILSNAFLLFGFGHAIMVRNGLGEYLGLFTVANGALHFGVANVIAKFRDDISDVIYVLTILVLTFVSIAIPIQFDGNVVTMVWAVEAALLFWFGRRRDIRMFEYFSYPVMALAIGSMFVDWMVTWGERLGHVLESNPMPLANGDLVTALVVVAALAYIFITNRETSDKPAIPENLVRPFGIIVAIAGTFILYNAFRIEVGNYFHLEAARLLSAGALPTDAIIADLFRFSGIWQLNYTMAFLIGMAIVNLRKLGSRLVAVANSAIGVAALAVFATVAMVWFFELRQSYLADTASAQASMKIGIRYVSYAFAGALFYSLYQYRRSDLLSVIGPAKNLRVGFEALVAIVLLIAASGELTHLMAQFGIPDAEKLGFSILWGVYAVAMIAYGIARNRKHLRVAAIGLLGVTLVMLFFYDAADLETIPKTILFVTVGITLLVASFLYNKYKALIFSIAVEEPE